MIFKTQVEERSLKVLDNFNLDLFKKLNPWWNLMEIIRFDGVRKDAITELKVGPFKQIFSTRIAMIGLNRFTDVGVKLPFPFTYWQHNHIIVPNIHGGTNIIDDIEYECFFLLTPFVHIYLTMMFKYRQKIYKKIFRRSV